MPPSNRPHLIMSEYVAYRLIPHTQPSSGIYTVRMLMLTLTAEFDYRWQTVKDGQFLREPSLRETTMLSMALQLTVDGECDD